MEQMCPVKNINSDKACPGMKSSCRQPEAAPEEPEEQRVDLQVVSEPNLSKSNACLNFHHFENSELWLS